MAVASIQTAFTAGEISPQLYARTDLEKFQIGAALIRNFFVDYRGGVTNRPGTRYIDTVLENSRLIPFVVSTSASYVLVFSENLITIYTAGELVTTVATPYLAVDLQRINYTQSADVLTLVHPSYPPANLSRTSDTTFVYELLTTGPTIEPPVITTFVAPHSGPYSFGYLVTAVDLDGKEESLPSNPGVKHSEAQNETTNRVIGLSWTAPPEPVSKYNIYKWGPIDAVTLNPATVWGFIGSSQTTTFTDNNIAPDFSKQPPGWGDPFSGGQFQSITVATGGSGYDGVGGDWPNIPYVPLDITGDGTDAAGYAVIDHATGTIIGVFLTNAGKNYTTATVTANGEGGTGATFSFTFSDPQPLNPACTAYLQQRRWFAGSDLKPETLVASNVGLYNNFDTTPISLATDALVISLASEQVNTIRAMVPVSYGMLIFTTGGSFLLNGGSPYAPITPSTVSVQAQASEGANFLRPLAINYDILYGQAKGNRIRNLAFAWQRQSYTGGDITQLAPHLFDGFHTTEWTWAEEPFKLVWAVRDDGTMLSLTYVPDQEVNAWARHDTQGLFKSVCSVPEGDTDAVYVIVQRHIPNEAGQPCWVWMLERFAERQSCCIYDAWFLDSALSLPKNFPDAPLYIVGGHAIGDTVDLYSYDPCGTPSGSFGTSGRIMEAVDNYNDVYGPQVSADTAPTHCIPTQLFAGMSYNPTRRKIMYVAYVCPSGNVTNDTGWDLWNGTDSIAVDATYDATSGKNLFVCEVDIDTRAVVWYDCWSPTSTVPASVFGDGTARRYTDTGTDDQGPTVADPRTGNIWVHGFGTSVACSIYLFRLEDSFQQIISPILDAGNHMTIRGMEEDWVYLTAEQFGVGNLLLTPRLLQGAEITADYLLAYATYALPAAFASSYNACITDDSGDMWWFSCKQSGTRGYALNKFTKPSPFVYPTPPGDGGFTTVTPWGGSTGPNTNVSAYTVQSTVPGPNQQCYAFKLPATNSVALLSLLLPDNTGVGVTNPNLWRLDCTYVNLGTLAFDFHQAFVTGYMTAEWVPTSDPALAAWNVRNFLQTNVYLDIHDQTVDGEDYTLRRFYFNCAPVVAGVIDPSSHAQQYVLVTYRFVSGAAPAVVSVYTEAGWDEAYPDFQTRTGEPNPMFFSIPRQQDTFEIWSDIGLYDAQSNAWWTSSYQSFDIFQLNLLYASRENFSGFCSPPFLRLSFGTSIGVSDCVHVDCGEVQITEVVDQQHMVGVVRAVPEELIPDDPDGTYAPMLAGDWWLTTPTTTITLAHLKGKEVWALADGHVVGPLTANASTGAVTLPFEACVVVAGLQYTQQIKTLYLTMDGLNQGTEQGKRKQISGITARVDCTLGPKMGSDFVLMYSPPEFATTVNDPASNTTLVTGDVRALNFPTWNTEGEICMTQTLPLPASILGIIVEVTPGDTGR